MKNKLIEAIAKEELQISVTDAIMEIAMQTRNIFL